jgi:4-azaleucine resistance transporter AzlC
MTPPEGAPMPPLIADSRRRLLFEAGVVGFAVAVVGVAYGAMSVNAGLPIWFAPVVGFFVLAASSEMLFVGLLAGGGNPLVAAAAALAVNSRHLPYGLAATDVLGTGWKRFLRIHLINDETVAFAAAQQTSAERRFAYTWSGLGILLTWPVGALLGSLIGRMFDVTIIGLDAMFPAVILALIMSAIRDSRTRYGCLAAAAIAIGAAIFLPEGIAPVLAVLALPLMRPRHRRTPRRASRRRRPRPTEPALSAEEAEADHA